MNRPCARVVQFFLALFLLSLAFTSLTWADEDDPPARVARMNFAQGQVSFQPGGEGEWVEAVPNRPLTTNDNLWTDRDSRAELHIGSTAIRLGSETSLTFLELDDSTVQLRLAQGSTLIRVRHLDDEDNLEIDTPNLAFRVQGPGEYRVDVNPDGHSTTIDAFHGRGEAIGGGNNYTVVAGQQAIFTGDNNLDYDIEPLPRQDGFDEWAFDRDRREDDDRSANYVSREMTGYEDLDDYGRWSYEGNYGPVWVPTGVPAGWAPYRFGHWVWVAPWGWTWVDDQPWGFAPFHYGRWCVIGGGWAWVPGPVVVRPVYAPALVAFVGGGGFHFSASFGGSEGVAWFPLGPGEVYVPSYHVSRTYVNQVNVTNTVVNVTKVTNIYNSYTTNNTTVVNNITYINRRQPNAVTAVSHETFVNARPVARNVVAVSAREVEQAPATHMAPVQPVRTSELGAGKPTKFAPPPAVQQRQVVAQRPPAQPSVPFNQRQDPLVARPTKPVAPVAAQPQPVRGQPSQPVRTEPNQPARNEAPQPVRNEAPQPAHRQEWQAPRPGSTPVNTPAPRQEAQPQQAQRPEAMRPVPYRPPQPQPEERQQQGWSHPLARPAPPVQEKTPQQAQQEERKFQNWQQKAQPQQQQRGRQEAPRPPEKDSKHR
jgi:hypothetical protein